MAPTHLSLLGPRSRNALKCLEAPQDLHMWARGETRHQADQLLKAYVAFPEVLRTPPSRPPHSISSSRPISHFLKNVLLESCQTGKDTHTRTVRVHRFYSLRSHQHWV